MSFFIRFHLLTRPSFKLSVGLLITLLSFVKPDEFLDFSICISQCYLHFLQFLFLMSKRSFIIFRNNTADQTKIPLVLFLLQHWRKILASNHQFRCNIYCIKDYFAPWIYSAICTSCRCILTVFWIIWDIADFPVHSYLDRPWTSIVTSCPTEDLPDYMINSPFTWRLPLWQYERCLISTVVDLETSRLTSTTSPLLFVLWWQSLHLVMPVLYWHCPQHLRDCHRNRLVRIHRTLLLYDAVVYYLPLHHPSHQQLFHTFQIINLAILFKSTNSGIICNVLQHSCIEQGLSGCNLILTFYKNIIQIALCPVIVDILLIVSHSISWQQSRWSNWPFFCFLRPDHSSLSFFIQRILLPLNNNMVPIAPKTTTTVTPIKLQYFCPTATFQIFHLFLLPDENGLFYIITHTIKNKITSIEILF